MRFLILLSFALAACASKDPALQPAVIEKVDCTFNFADYKAPLDINSKLYRSAEVEVRNETERVVTQRAVFKTGEEVLFTGGGCAHLSYAFTYSGLKLSKKDAKTVMSVAMNLLAKTPVTDGRKNPLLKALKDTHRKDAKEIVAGQYELNCGDANCSVDSREAGVIQLKYDFAL